MSDSPLALVPRGGSQPVTQRARDAFDDRQIELIRATVARDCTLAELHMLLELAARYDLDVFAHEIWAVKLKKGDDEPVTIMVARDGLLRIAQRTEGFQGIEGDVVRENDEFRKEAGSELPKHSYGAKDRGAVLGAWATVHREGRTATYFYAPFNEYCPPKDGGKYKYSPWSRQESAMILKCAEAMALRKAFSITGVVSEEEMARSAPVLLNGAKVALDAIESGDDIEWGDAPDVRLWLQGLVADLEAAGETVRPAKLRAMLGGRTDDERIEYALTLVDQLAQKDVPVRARLSIEEATEILRGPQEPAEDVQDAELVDADEPPADFVAGGPSDPDEPLFGSDAA